MARPRSFLTRFPRFVEAADSSSFLPTFRQLMQLSGPWQSQLHGGRTGNVCALR
jgi:hypothetical protein